MYAFSAIIFILTGMIIFKRLGLIFLIGVVALESIFTLPFATAAWFKTAPDLALPILTNVYKGIDRFDDLKTLIPT
jgi:hypothetical protein